MPDDDWQPLGGPDGFFVAFGAGLALAREGDNKIYLVFQNGDNRKVEISPETADCIGIQFCRTADTARYWKDRPPTGLGGETSGDD